MSNPSPNPDSHPTDGAPPHDGSPGSSLPPPAPLPPPDVPDHELIRRIGRGAYGEVWIARSVTGAYRAVKIVHRASFDHNRPFDREFEGIQKFEPISRRHESQVDILHVGRSEDCFYYVMELADDQATGGQILDPADYKPRTLKSDLLFRSRLPFEECVQIGIALTTALEHLHSHGLVHRDVKPSNIIVVNGVAKLADIGLVTGVDATRSYVGTEGFAAPEGPGTAQADLFSLGKVLYEMATGKDRQEFPELPTLLRELPDREGLMELNAVIARACRHDPKDRYASAAAMRTDLELLQSGKSLARLHRLEERLRFVQKAGALVTVLAVLIAAGWYYHARQNRLLVRLVEEKLVLAQENARLAEFERLQLLDQGFLKDSQGGNYFIAGPITNQVNHHVYYLMDNLGPAEAEKSAQRLGGHLATIRNAEEQEWVFETFGNWNNIPRQLIIGLYRHTPDQGAAIGGNNMQDFHWLNGEPVSYRNWGEREPNTWEQNAEQYVHIRAPSGFEPGRWNDFSNVRLVAGIGTYGVVEVIPKVAKE